ncbi:hypothetical protein [Streptomyces sp. NPDC002952]|uniref:hypothetical protein n=1 Tax=Streptomyces sp. NPDC002952 TaxID=3364673 RepID=UPI0036C234B9
MDDTLAVKRVRETVESGGGFEVQLAEIGALAAYRGGNWTPLVERFFRPDRPTMVKLARTLTFASTSQDRDRSVLDALGRAVAHRPFTRELIPAGTGDGTALDLLFASAQWRATVYAKGRSGMLVRRPSEAAVFSYLVEELRCGNIAVASAEDFGDWTRMLLPWEGAQSPASSTAPDLPTALPRPAARVTPRPVPLACSFSAG